MMKNKLFLGLLPALLVLTSCQTAPKVEPKVNFENVIEDTEAHDEIFGQSKSEFYQIGVRKLDIPLTPDDNDLIPAIGVQTKVDDKGNSNPFDDTISIRFVAAVKLADYASASVVWTRTMYDDGGDVVSGKETDTFTSSRGYQSIASADADPLDENPDELTISAFNSAHGTDYTHFVVYTMRNIPCVSAEFYYLNAYVTVNGSVSSKELAFRVDKRIILSFNNDQTGYFLVDNENNVVEVNESIKGSNLAAFSTVLKYDGYFSIVEKGASLFKVHNASLKTDDNSDYFVFKYDDVSVMPKFGLNVGASYNIYLSSTNELSVSASGTFVRPIYVNLDWVKGWWYTDKGTTAVYAYNSSTNAYHWYATTEYGTNLWVTEDAIDPSVYNYAIVVRYSSDYSLPLDGVWTGKINQSGDAVIPTNGFNDCIKVGEGEIGGGKKDFIWESRLAA